MRKLIPAIKLCQPIKIALAPIKLTRRPIYKFTSMDKPQVNGDKQPEQAQGEQKLSKNALKKLQKAEQKAKEKSEKEQAKPKAEKQKEDEITDPQEYYKNRCAIIEKLKHSKEFFPYPHKFQLTHLIPKLREEYNEKCTENGVFLDDEIAIAGRVHSIRASGKNLVFYDLKAEGAKIQIMANSNQYGDENHFNEIKHIIKRGDIIGVKGKIGKSKTGELSIAPTLLQLLSPCLHMLPKNVDKKDEGTKEALTDQETRYRQRYLDLIVNNKPKHIFITRSKVIQHLRQEFNQRDFLEVETPVLNILAGGATAKPFETHHKELDRKMFLRIAPELFLKNCVVGGIDRVYEIGKQFRNEGIDHTHNPEFTSCELYWAYADYEDLIKFTEEVLCSIIEKVKGSLKFEITDDYGKKIPIDFSRPWKRISMMDELSKILNATLPEDLESPEAHDFFDKMCKKHNVVCSEPRTTARLIDKLIGHFVEPNCVNPTFITEQPQIMCPLAKYHRNKKGLTERFELFINRKEFVNAYTELNDPFIQMQQFQLQVKEKELGNDEASPVDDDFVKCLEHALPPTGGWGLGIDRFVMLLTDSINIQEVILFPTMKPRDDKPQSN